MTDAEFQEAAAALFQDIDQDNSGTIELEEMIMLEKRLHSMTLPAARWELQPKKKKPKGEQLAEHKSDAWQHTVKLSAEENAKLGATASKLEFEDMDANNDGKVTMNEWIEYLEMVTLLHDDGNGKGSRKDMLMSALRRSVSGRRDSEFEAHPNAYLQS